MKKSVFTRSLLSSAMIFSLLFVPLGSVSASSNALDKGSKNYKQGLVYEDSKQWDKAVEEFALAVVASPKNAEYQLHYRRALFNASQMMMERGRLLAEQKDYTGAYNAFRMAYGYDAVNELAKAEMERMMRLKAEADEEKERDKNNTVTPDVKLVPTAYTSAPQTQRIAQTVPSARVEELREFKFEAKRDLKFIIRELARELDLNVLFDSEYFRQPREISGIELRDVTVAQALDQIFLQEGLFFQRVGRKTILVAPVSRRQNFQQLVLKTYYLSNADPEKVRNLISQAIPAQPGRTPTQVLVDKDTNSLTVRDTGENVRLIGQLINSLDKDRAAVVIDVNIYEVSRTDLSKIGLQIGDQSGLSNFGGISSATVGTRNYGQIVSQTGVVGNLPRAFGFGINVPTLGINAFQGTNNAKLLASTQVHAFNNESSKARIGQRVPVRTAQILGYANQTNNQPGSVLGNGFGNVGEVVNYEPVGLTLEFKPLVFPNQDVQVEMKIESKDVVGGNTANPTFSERTINGTARIRNNNTLLLASVAQDVQSNGKSGIPLLSALPVLGRLFATPTKENRQVDIVIAVTPRVLRAPIILAEDIEERQTGSLVNATSGSVESVVREIDDEERLAVARRLENTARLEAQQNAAAEEKSADAPTYVSGIKTNIETTKNEIAEAVGNVEKGWETVAPSVKTLDNKESLKDVALNPTVYSAAEVKARPTSLTENALSKPEETADKAEFHFVAQPLKTGETQQIPILIKSPTALRSALLALNFDGSKMRVKKVSYGEIFGANAAKQTVAPFVNEGGKLIVNLKPSPVTVGTAGILAYIEVEAISDVTPAFAFDETATNLLGADGGNLLTFIRK